MLEYWPMLRQLVAVLVALLHGQDDNGMEIYFTSSTNKFGSFTEPKDFVDTINAMKPGDKDARKRAGSTEDANPDDITDVLLHLLGLAGKAVYKENFTLIVLTDGIWKGIQKKRTVANGIVNCLERWENKTSMKDKLGVRGFSIQFVQFGNDKDASEEFGYMDDDLKYNDGTTVP
jgi:hypothetical protein